jgi:hypothetical protein
VGNGARRHRYKLDRLVTTLKTSHYFYLSILVITAYLLYSLFYLLGYFEWQFAYP